MSSYWYPGVEELVAGAELLEIAARELTKAALKEETGENRNQAEEARYARALKPSFGMRWFLWLNHI
tara:strand:- start:65 stop:265 length:201 start_codon:yes stop_codon:yes gene_type:complete